MSGMNVEIEAKADLKAKGLNATVEGTAQAEFKAGAMASLTGAIVKIN